MRAILTILGILIGVGAVVAMVSVGSGASSQIISEVQDMGPNLIFIRPGATTVGGVRQATGTARTLTYEDAQAISELPYVDAVAPQASTFAQVSFGGKNVNTRIVGVTPEYTSVRNSPIEVGEFISPHHIRGKSMVCVLGSYTSETLFGDSDSVGEMIKVGSRHFRVVGIMESKGGGEEYSEDDRILIPLTTLGMRIDPQLTPRGEHIVSRINVQAADQEHMERVKEEIVPLLRERHKLPEHEEDDFEVTTQEDIMDMISNITGILIILLGSIAGISLLVAGIGIMNIMLVSVTERTREIGIRKAVGAKRKDILLQFLLEASVLSIGGGIVGIIFGWGISSAISQLGNIPTSVSPGVVVLAFLIALMIGLASGIYPAFRAARLNTVDALRYE
jgi:putative ABC transport system permease protein